MSKRKRESSLDVEILCDILQAHLQKDGDTKVQSMGRLSCDHARRCVTDLLKHDELVEIFNELLRIPGLRDGWSITQWHKYNRFCEKVLRYLQQLKVDWERIVPLHEARYKIDHTTVKAIEGKCPKYSSVDAENIFLQLEQGLIFTAFSQDERQGVWDAIFSIDHTIPSLYTLLKDLHILQTCAESIGYMIGFSQIKARRTPMRKSTSNRLGTPTFESTLRSYFQCQEDENTFPVEVGSRVFCRVPVPIEDRFNLGERILWLFSLRNYKRLKPPRRGQKLLVKAEPERVNEAVLHEFAVLAYEIGFKSPNIGRILRRHTQHEPNRHYGMYKHNSIENPQRRYGLPIEYTYEQDKNLLYLHKMHQEVRDEKLTSFFILKSVYFTFFGKSLETFEFTTSILEALNMAAQENITSTTRSFRRNELKIIPAEPILNLPKERSRDYNQEGESDRSGIVARADCPRDHSLDNTSINTISFKLFEDGCLKTLQEVSVQPSHPLEVEDTAQRFRNEGLHPFSTRGKALLPGEVFNSAISSGLDTIILLPGNNVRFDKALLEALASL
ncbi:hypothetical protein BX600DRAFT_440113 [Xylariales sp. PMI_506]|nr:hypothetical protein BX600DRAFT_440113 [Xylariales sp. PMI_506]